MKASEELSAWRVLVVDDEPALHDLISMSLAGFEHQGRPLELLHADSAAEARLRLETTPEVAVLLCDVAMETPRAGLDLVDYIRREMGNDQLRIILLTGNVAEVPRQEVIVDYGINNYLEKTEATTDRLFCALYEAISNFQHLQALRSEIAHRTKSQLQLKEQSDHIRELNEELQQFAFVASHDMQEPLRKVWRFGNQLAADYGEVLDARGRDYLERMNSGARRMSELISKLLELSRVGAHALKFEAVDLAQLLPTVINDFSTVLQETGGEVLCEALPTVIADASQMHQLFSNLIANGLKFRAPDQPPQIRISARQITRAGTNWQEIVVQDQGVGFDAPHAERIFLPFERGHIRSQYEGAGIGLSVCRKIVDRHGGKITAHSRRGEGAEFRIVLPVAGPRPQVYLDSET